MIVGTPVYFSGANGALTAVLDRVFYAAQTKGTLFNGKPAATIATMYRSAATIATMYRSGANHAIDRINKYFLFNNMSVIPTSYWSLKFADNSSVENDEKGRLTMKNLGINMAEYLKNTH